MPDVANTDRNARPAQVGCVQSWIILLVGIGLLLLALVGIDLPVPFNVFVFVLLFYETMQTVERLWRIHERGDAPLRSFGSIGLALWPLWLTLLGYAIHTILR